MTARFLGTVGVFSLLLWVAGCGSKDPCKDACKKIAQCSGVTGDGAPAGGGASCPFSSACSLKEECKAKCVSNASCDAILGKDPAGSQSLAACQAACEATTPDGAAYDQGTTDGGIGDQGGTDFLSDSLPPDQYVPLPDQYIPPDTTVDPDLTVTSFTAKASGASVTFTATVCNNGASTSSTFDLELYYDLSYAPGCSTTSSYEWKIYGLAGGACKTENHTMTASTSGTYTGWARVDADCKVIETDEYNNNKSASYSVTVGPTQPDLTVTSFTAMPSGTSVTFAATICNNGASTSTNFDLEFYYDLTSAPGCTTTCSKEIQIYGGLAAGACKTETHVYTGAPSSGTYTGWARVDADCAITELDEYNNNKSAPYTMGGGGGTTYTFETGTMQGITETHSDSAVMWQVASTRPYAGSYSMYYGNPTAKNFAGSGTNYGTATLPQVMVPGQGSSSLTFWLWMDTEISSSYDILYVKIGGTNVWTKTTTTVPAAKTWQQVTVDLNSYAGQSVQVSLYFNTMDSAANSGEGVYVDDIAFNLGAP